MSSPADSEEEERTITYSSALNEALREEMHRDPAVIVMGEDVAAWGEGGGVFGVTKNLAGEFGVSRVRDTPISEEAIVSLGVGAAMTGLRPVVELMYFDFVTLAMDPLVNQAAKVRYMFGGQARVPLVLRSNIGASGGKAAQHSQSFESWLLHVPGLKVALPSTPHDAKGLLKTAIRDDNPVVFLEHKLLYFDKGVVPREEYLVPFGQAVMIRAGKHITVVATHTMLQRASEAAEVLAEEGIELEIIDPRTLVPLDIDSIIASVARTHRLLICHEAVGRGGWAGEVALQVGEQAFDELDAPIARVCGADVPIPYSAPLEEAVIPGVTEIVVAARRLVGERSQAIAVARKSSSPRPSMQPETPTTEVSGRVAAKGRPVLLPRLSDTMESGTVARWLKDVGDHVREHDELVEIETDKVSMVIESECSGTLRNVLVNNGEAAAVGSILAYIEVA